MTTPQTTASVSQPTPMYTIAFTEKGIAEAVRQHLTGERTEAVIVTIHSSTSPLAPSSDNSPSQPPEPARRDGPDYKAEAKAWREVESLSCMISTAKPHANHAAAFNRATTKLWGIWTMNEAHESIPDLTPQTLEPSKGECQHDYMGRPSLCSKCGRWNPKQPAETIAPPQPRSARVRDRVGRSAVEEVTSPTPSPTRAGADSPRINRSKDMSKDDTQIADPWIVHVKGSADRDGEISVLRESNTHGQRSYGWFGSDKHLIAGGGGPCEYTYHPHVWARHLATAKSFADELNAVDAAVRAGR